MHPAYSIIFFTTSSGLGYGLAAMLGLGLLDPSSAWVKFAHLLALALIAGGLLSSTFHLGNPQRAWRALFDYYIFGPADKAGAHLPEAARGMLGPLDEIKARRLRSQLLQRLNR